MSKEYSFTVMPSVSISRSRFARKSQHKTAFNMGYIVPVYCDEVLPGDTRSIDMASLVRMSTPIAPIMDNIYLDFYAFFVPNRLVWTHWKEFMGENSTSAGIPSTTYSIPTVFSTSDTSYYFDVNSYADYLGLPTGVTGLGSTTFVNVLPFRGIALIYNEWFRNQNIIAPLPVNTGDTYGALISGNYDFIAKGVGLLKASKLADYFTTSLPYAQKGAAVSIPLGTTAPIVGAPSAHDISSKPLKFGITSVMNAKLNLTTDATGVLSDDGTTVGSTQLPVSYTNMVADLSSATAATINQLRYAFQLQKFLEKDALYGSRYWEILAAHFGIKAPDATLQRPEFLGGQRVRVNVDQVLTTSGYDDTSAQEVGKPGANSVTASKFSLFTKSFVEHGYIFILAVARHDQTYGQGINRMWSRQSRYDFYFPVFANLGAQDVKLKEIYATGTAADNNVFSYQEAWAEYRFKPSICTSLMNPHVTGSLNYWTLGNNFSASPTLGKAFIEQGRDNIQRALVTGSGGPDFIADFYFEDIAVRPMPMYSIPGLIDHH